MGTDQSTLCGNLDQVRRRIEAAARRSGRNPDDIELVAVSKNHPVELIRAALGAGQPIFGENRIQEALGKIDALGPGPRWHLLGHLQRNKVNKAVGRFELFHSVDSVRLIEAVEKRAAALDLRQRVLLQVNVSGEASKEGIAPAELPELLAALRGAGHVEAAGLMTVPPYSEDPEQSRPFFRQLRALLETHAGDPGLRGRHLSMGMSGDFEVAVEEGATFVRVGTAIFGERVYS